MADNDQNTAAGETRTITFVRPTRVVRIRVRTVASVSVGRLVSMVLMWIGIPAGILLAPAYPTGDPGAVFFQGWMWAGVGTICLNAAGVLTLRGRSVERIEDEGDEAGGAA